MNTPRSSLALIAGALMTMALVLVTAPGSLGADARLGGVDFDGYCRHLGYNGAILVGPAQGPLAAYNWRCATGNSHASIDVTKACRWNYGKRLAYARAGDINDAYTWSCYLERVRHHHSIRSFNAAPYGGISPGDPDLAVGPNYIVETINTSMTIYDREGTKIGHREFNDLFSSSNAFCADPRVIYSSWDRRYAIVCTDIGPSKTVRLAVSRTADPSGGWRTYTTGPGTAVDQPSVEATRDKLVVAGSAGSGTSVWVFQKADILRGRTHPRVRHLRIDRGQYTAAVQATPARSAYLVQAFPGGNDVYLYRVSGTPKSGVHTRNRDLGHYRFKPPGKPTIPGGFLGGGYLDGRVLNAVYEATPGGRKIVEFSGMAQCGSRVCLANTRLDVSGGAPHIRSVRTFKERHFDDTYGAVAVDRRGRPFDVYTRSSATKPPQAVIVGAHFRNVVGRATAGAPACAKAVSDASCDERWGYYLGAVQDPAHRNSLWFVGLYQSASGGDGWTTVIARVSPH